MGTITKSDIVQRLLDNKHISAEEAVILLSSNELQAEIKPVFPFGTLNPYLSLMGIPPLSLTEIKDKSNKPK